MYNTSYQNCETNQGLIFIKTYYSYYSYYSTYKAPHFRYLYPSFFFNNIYDKYFFLETCCFAAAVAAITASFLFNSVVGWRVNLYIYPMCPWINIWFHPPSFFSFIDGENSPRASLYSLLFFRCDQTVFLIF